MKSANSIVKKSEGFFSNFIPLPWKESEIKDPIWSKLMNSVALLLIEQANEEESFIRPYIELFDQVKALQYTVSNTAENLNAFASRQTLLAANLAKAEHIWDECDRVLTTVRMVLSGHLKSIPESDAAYFISFLKRHWGKITIGSGGGGGLTWGLCVLLAGNPWLILVGIMVGGSSGAISGVGVDHFSKTSNDQPDERKPLFDKQQPEDKKSQAEKESHVVLPPALVYQPLQQSSWWPRWTYGTFWPSSDKAEVPNESQAKESKRFFPWQ